MKPMVGLALLAAGLGLWAGFRAAQSASEPTLIQAGVASLIAGNLIFMTWVWYRARPGSGDAMVLPGLVVLSVAMLVGLVPRLLWPGHDRIQIGGSVVSVALTSIVVVTTVRRNRQLRTKARSFDGTSRPA
jgi:hypothetical protein